MDEIKFKSLEELYIKLLPAFKTKINELERHNIKGIKEETIWNYLKDNYWKNKKDLTLGEMVDDILNTPNDKIVTYVLNNRK